MSKLRSRAGRSLLGLVGALAIGCGSNGAASGGPGGGNDGGIPFDATVPPLGPDDGGSPFGDGAAATLQVTPTGLQTITVNAGATTPTVAFSATYGGQPASAAWSVDRSDIGAVAVGPAITSTFSPRGTTGGVATVTASLNGQTVTRQVFVQLVAQQNGIDPTNPGEAGQNPTSPGQLAGGGGVGGVGGEGLGPPVTDPGTISALGSPGGDASGAGLALLYPYDRTIWPRGMLAPLLMWTWATNDADAIQIVLKTTSGSFSYKGTFGRPAILAQTNGPYVRSPIPQDVWEMATNTAGGTTPTGATDQLTMALTIAKGGTGYGPVTQTWNVAPGRLTGTVYYNSYGTQYVKNWTSLDKAGHSVGAAILGIHSGDLAPHLVVGQNSPTNSAGNPADDSGCRVCHVVSSHGRWVLTQSEQGTPGDGLSFLYDLNNQDAGAATLPQQGTFAWAAMTSDGTYALTNTIDPSSTNPAITNSAGGNATSSFWKFGGAPVQGALTGLASGAAAGYPAYAPDDKLVAFVDATGSTSDVHGPLVVASYAAATQQFSAVRTLIGAEQGDAAASNPPTGQRIGYPVFLPDDSALLFENELRTSSTDKVMVTRDGARSELWWITLGATPKAAPLYALNGRTAGGAGSYLPSLPNNHGIAGASDPRDSYSETGWDDTTLDYEPTVLPVVVGGYAWVVFTSRRAYGNQLTAVPWQSWPPDYDTTSLAQAPVKKLWVAAIDLNAPPGTDPSHPAFYLPAQEILAGNSRGFWVLDPCAANGAACTTGDQCCNGYCGPGADGGLACGSVPTTSCAGTQDKCTTAADCCDKTNQCINGFCAQPPPK